MSVDPTKAVPASKEKPRILPCEAGYRMPAEWEPHRATWLAWPDQEVTWSGQLAAIQNTWIEFIVSLAPGEAVNVLVRDGGAEESVRDRLRRCRMECDSIRFYRIPTVDVWIRDYGPTFLTTKRKTAPGLALVDWAFNAWGGKYDAYLADDRVAGEVAAALGVPCFRCPMVLEGGSIEVNGCGTCMITEQCLMNSNRNPGWSRTEIEGRLSEHLGVKHFIWLAGGVIGDDTDGHVDNLARFVGRNRVVCVVENAPSDENYGALQENYERLRSATDERGQKLEVVTLPQPGRLLHGAQRLPASYANFYIANDVVLMPGFGNPQDAAALNVLTGCFPGRKVVAVHSKILLQGLGGIHCVTQQEPIP